MKNNRSDIPLIALLLIVVSGCSLTANKSDGIDPAATTPPLELPPGLVQPKNDSSMGIPSPRVLNRIKKKTNKHAH